MCSPFKKYGSGVCCGSDGGGGGGGCGVGGDGGGCGGDFILFTIINSNANFFCLCLF